jgi:hypothetical protein
MTVRKTGWALFFCAFLASVAIESGELASWDAGNRLQVTRWLWTDEPPVSDPGGWFGIYGRNGERYAWYGLGQSVWMSPAYLVSLPASSLVSSYERIARKFEEIAVTYLTFPLTSALIVLVLYALMLRSGFGTAVAGLGSLGAFWCTSLLPYTEINQENSLLLLCTVTSMWAVASGVADRRFFWWCLAGFAAGLGLLTRLTFVFDGAAIALFGSGLIALTRPETWSAKWRHFLPRILLAALVCAVFVFIDRAYHFYRFESWTSTYYDIIFEQRGDVVKPGSFWIGFPALAWSIKHNIWQFDPVALLGLIAVPAFWRTLACRQRIFAVAAVLLLSVYLCFYSSTHDQFDGAAAWGCRYVTTPMVLLGAFGIAAVLDRRGQIRPLLKTLAVLLVLAGFLVQLLSTVFWYNLEEVQQIEGLGASSSMVALRAQNVAALATDRWEEWGLLPSGESKRMRTPNYFPFLVSKYLPPSGATAAKVIWAVFLLAALSLNLWLLLRLRRDLCKDSEPCGSSPVL